jgi:Ribosomal protein L7/L12 C-terminal domain
MNHEPAKASLPEVAISALQRGNKLEAIKLLRQERGLGLKEAKDEVEQYLRTQPSLQATFATAQSLASRSGLLWLLLLIGGGILLYVYLTRH